MANNTVNEFARELKVSADTLLSQLKAAGVQVKTVNDEISDADKRQLLDSLRQERVAAPRKITVTRRETSTIRQNDGQGGARTIEVEVRRRRVFVKNRAAEAMRAEIEAQAKAQLDRELKEKQEAEAAEAAKREAEAKLAAEEAAKKAAEEAAAKKAAEEKAAAEKAAAEKAAAEAAARQAEADKLAAEKAAAEKAAAEKARQAQAAKLKLPRKRLLKRLLPKKLPPRRPNSKLAVRKPVARLRKKPKPSARCLPSLRPFSRPRLTAVTRPTAMKSPRRLSRRMRSKSPLRRTRRLRSPLPTSPKRTKARQTARAVSRLPRATIAGATKTAADVAAA